MLTNKEVARVEPRTFMRQMLRDFDRFFEEGWAPFTPPARVFGDVPWMPALEVAEKDHKVTVRLDLPGVKKEEVTVTLTEEGLLIEGERKLEVEKKENTWYRTERTYGHFTRLVPLPAGVKANEIKAAFENGVLEVIVPLPAEAAAPAPRKVEITGGEVPKAAAKSAA